MHHRRCFLVLIASTTLSAQIKVKQTPADVKTRTFDPKNPTKEMPKLNPGEAAVTDSVFSCQVQIEVETTPLDNGKATMKIVAVTADLDLAVTMWLPKNVSTKIRAHESGHREISEDFYKPGDDITKKIAQKYIGKEYALTAAEQSNTTPVIQRIANEFCGEYQGQTEVPCAKVQDRYDDLTDHGRNRLLENDAIAQAMKESPKTK